LYDPAFPVANLNVQIDSKRAVWLPVWFSMPIDQKYVLPERVVSPS